MRHTRFVSIVLAAIMLAAMVPAVPAMGAVAPMSAPVGTEFQVTTETHSQNQIEFQGDTVVYADHRAGQPRVYGFDLGGNSEFPVSITSGAQNNASVYGDYIVYMKKRMVWDEADKQWEDVGDIWGYKISTGENFPICTDDAEQGNPFIWGDTVVWVDHRNTSDPIDGTWNECDLYGYDLATGEESLVTTQAGGQHAPALYEDQLVWRDRGNPSDAIWHMDLTTGEAEAIATLTAPWDELTSPNVWGDWIVWHERDYNAYPYYFRVMAYNLKTETTKEVVASYQSYSYPSPDVWDGLVVWVQGDTVDSAKSGDIHMTDLATDEETVICDDPYRQERPRIENGTVVWVDERNNLDGSYYNADVYGMYLMPHQTTYAGVNRYETAVTTSKKTFADGAENVVIATGANWPDALSAAALAAAVDGPILLVRTDAIPAIVAKELARLGARNAYIVGGTGAVSAGVEADLGAMLNGTVQRVAGSDRYATSQAVSAKAVAMMGAGWDGTAFVATGASFPDAVAASALSAGLGWPLYLTKPTELPASTASAMDAAGVKDVYVLGGTGAVSAGVMSAVDAKFGAVERLAGDDRYKTALAVAEKGVDEGMTWDGVAFATGTNFPDALTGGVAQGKNGSVMVLTQSTALNPAVAAKIEANKADIGLVRFLGGAGAISDAVKTAVMDIVTD